MFFTVLQVYILYTFKTIKNFESIKISIRDNTIAISLLSIDILKSLAFSLFFPAHLNYIIYISFKLNQAETPCQYLCSVDGYLSNVSAWKNHHLHLIQAIKLNKGGQDEDIKVQ